MAYTELDLHERRAIEDMLNAKMPVSKIAAALCTQAARPFFPAGALHPSAPGACEVP
nr:helix-turn-helix domain-containing protein [Leisingera methylohalidivorans]